MANVEGQIRARLPDSRRLDVDLVGRIATGWMGTRREHRRTLHYQAVVREKACPMQRALADRMVRCSEARVWVGEHIHRKTERARGRSDDPMARNLARALGRAEAAKAWVLVEAGSCGWAVQRIPGDHVPTARAMGAKDAVVWLQDAQAGAAADLRRRARGPVGHTPGTRAGFVPTCSNRVLRGGRGVAADSRPRSVCRQILVTVVHARPACLHEHVACRHPDQSQDPDCERREVASIPAPPPRQQGGSVVDC